MKVAEQYNEIKNKLSAITKEAEAEAKLMMAQVYGCELGALILRFCDESRHEKEIQELVEKRLKGKPLAYVLNQRNFYGYDFYVDENVLIPRFDTEPVVEFCIKEAESRKYETAIDLCCGSGCIGITLLLESKIKKLTFGDISEKALKITQKNAENLGVYDRSEFVLGNLFENIQNKVDIIVSNPPYISNEEYNGLANEVRMHEPKTALVAENEGYFFYERLAKEGKKFLKSGGLIVLEIGCTQHIKVEQLLKNAGFGNIKCGKDIENRPRFVSGII